MQTFEATRAIYRGYVDVGFYAIIIVVVMLLVDLRSFSDVLLAMLPPLVGAVMTAGTLGFVDVPLNPANLIILPLIVGIGVDGGVHVLHDFRQHGGSRYRISPSTFGAIVLNQLTTVVGFGSLMMAAHRGLFSLGLVLTVGVVSCMIVAVVLLPAMLVFVSHARKRAELASLAEVDADEVATGLVSTSKPLGKAGVGELVNPAWLDASTPPATILGTGKQLPAAAAGRRSTEMAPLSAIGVSRRTAPAKP